MTQENHQAVARPHRDDRPKVSPKEDAQNRIKALEAAKGDPDYSSADIAALDRVIARLKDKLNG